MVICHQRLVLRLDIGECGLSVKYQTHCDAKEEPRWRAVERKPGVIPPHLLSSPFGDACWPTSVPRPAMISTSMPVARKGDIYRISFLGLNHTSLLHLWSGGRCNGRVELVKDADKCLQKVAILESVARNDCGAVWKLPTESSLAGHYILVARQ